jgi:hypothetical protein
VKLYDCLYPHDRAFLPRAPLPGMVDVLVDGQRFYAIKDGTGGARDLSRYDPVQARAWPTLSPGALVVVNIESRSDRIGEAHRPLRSDVRIHVGRDISNDCAFIRQVIADVRTGSETAPVGLYGILPTGYNVFNSVITNDTNELRRSQIANDFLALELIECFDTLHPSLYVNSTNIQHWQRFARWQVDECRRLARAYGIGLPIIPFISPEIHPSAGRGLISPEFWQTQIKTLRDLGCDGAVLWYSSANCTMKQIGPYADMAVRAIAPTTAAMNHGDATAAFPQRTD